MRVLHVMASGAVGGGATHLCRLLPALRELGFECEAAAGDDGPLADRLESMGFRAHRVELMRARLDPAAPARLASLLRAVRPDVVHWHGTRAAFFGAWALPRLGRAPRAVYTAHGLSYRKDLGPAGRALYLGVELVACRAADHVISVSRADLEDLLRRRLVVPDRATHIPNPLDVERFADGDRAAARAALDLPADAFVCGTVARLVAGKAVGDLLDAVERLPAVTLLVVGDGPLRAGLEVRARPLGDRVRFLGTREDLPTILPALDVFALPSRWEGEPVALLEALAAGLPCVATATEGARAVLEGTGAGILVPVGSPAALAAAIAQVAEAAFERMRMARAAREAVAGRSSRKVAEAVARVYGR